MLWRGSWVVAALVFAVWAIGCDGDGTGGNDAVDCEGVEPKCCDDGEFSLVSPQCIDSAWVCPEDSWELGRGEICGEGPDTVGGGASEIVSDVIVDAGDESVADGNAR